MDGAQGVAEQVELVRLGVLSNWVKIPGEASADDSGEEGLDNSGSGTQRAMSSKHPVVSGG